MVKLAWLAALIGWSTSVPCFAQPKDAVAQEAVNEALTLPPGYKRDRVLRAVSRNLRWFGQHEAGVRAARAMTDRGVNEVPPGQGPSQPRYVPLREAMPVNDPCDQSIWREADGSQATTPKARADWAERCLLRRDFHWTGLPPVEQVRAVAAGLPAGEIKALVLAMLIRSYRDAESLRFAEQELKRDNGELQEPARVGLTRMLADPAVLYKLGRKAEAIAAAEGALSLNAKAEFIKQLIKQGEVADAVGVFNRLKLPASAGGDQCDELFYPLGPLRLMYVGNASKPVPAIGMFLDQVANGPVFKAACPGGVSTEVAVGHSLAAGRLDEAVAKARTKPSQPFLAIDALLQAGQARLRAGDRASARSFAIEAGRLLPPYDPGDPRPITAGDGAAMTTAMGDTNAVISGKLGEVTGNTQRRFRVVQLIAATGAVDEAVALARTQPAGGLRAVALSAGVAGEAGIRFDEQAPTLSTIDGSDL